MLQRGVHLVTHLKSKMKNRAQPGSNDPEKVRLQAQVIELRSKVWSFPAIAKHLDISVGTMWNMTHANVSEDCDQLDRLEYFQG